MEIASNLKATSTSSSRLGPESMPGSKPRTVAKARSKPSTVQVEDVQLPETEEASTQVVTQSVNTADKWIKFVAWFAMMGAMSGYGIHQHDDTILFGVMILVTIGCGFGQAIEPLIKFLEAKGISPTKTLKS